VLAEQIRVSRPVSLEKSRRSLDFREEKGHGSGRKLARTHGAIMSPSSRAAPVATCPGSWPMKRSRKSRGEGGNWVVCLVEEIHADADAAEGLPETDVELELHARLLLMKDVGQLDHDGPVLRHLGSAFVSAQEKGEIVPNPGFARPQANRH